LAGGFWRGDPGIQADQTAAHPRYLRRKVSLTDAQFAIRSGRMLLLLLLLFMLLVYLLYFPTICYTSSQCVCAIRCKGTRGIRGMGIRALVMAVTDISFLRRRPPPFPIFHGQQKQKQRQKSRYFTCELFVSGKLSAHVSP